MNKKRGLLGVLFIAFLAASVIAGLAVGCTPDETTGLPPRNTGTGNPTSNGTGGGSPTSNGTGGGSPTSNGTGGGSPTSNGTGDGEEIGPGDPIDPTSGDYGTISNNELSPYQWVIASGTANFNSGTAGDEGYISVNCMGSNVVEINGMLGSTNKAKDYDGVTFEINVSERMDVLVMLREEHDGKAWRLSETKNVNTNGAWAQYKSPFSMAQDTGWGGNFGTNIKTWLGTPRSLLLYICPSNGGKEYKLRKIGFYKGSNSASTATTILWTPTANDNMTW